VSGFIILLVKSPAVLVAIVSVVNFIVGILLWVIPWSSSAKNRDGKSRNETEEELKTDGANNQRHPTR